MKKYLVILSVFLLLITACGNEIQDSNNAQETPYPTAPAQETLQEQQSVSNPQPAPTPQSPSVSQLQVKEFTINAQKFSFNPATITVNKGDTVRLKVTAGDVNHGIGITAYGIRKDLSPGQEVTIEFVADKSGEFPLVCTVFCGSGHGSMRGLLIVQ